MKKVLLLIVAAVFVIGIQSCSTEENILEDQLEQTVTENDAKFPGGNFCAFFVRFPADWTQQDREDFHAYATQEWFTHILRLYDQDCYNVEEWRVPCDQLYKIIRTDSVTNNATDADSKASEDDPTHRIYTLKAKVGFYDSCDEVPLHGEL
ncbi:hypothetical protein [Aquimarina litoralis]